MQRCMTMIFVRDFVRKSVKTSSLRGRIIAQGAKVHNARCDAARPDAFISSWYDWDMQKDVGWVEQAVSPVGLRSRANPCHLSNRSGRANLACEDPPSIGATLTHSLLNIWGIPASASSFQLLARRMRRFSSMQGGQHGQVGQPRRAVISTDFARWAAAGAPVIGRLPPPQDQNAESCSGSRGPRSHNGYRDRSYGKELPGKGSYKMASTQMKKHA